MLPTTAQVSRPSASRRNQAHAQGLLRLLASKVDSMARSEIYRRDAARRGACDYEAEFGKIQESDRKHVEWLKKEIVRNAL